MLCPVIRCPVRYPLKITDPLWNHRIPYVKHRDPMEHADSGSMKFIPYELPEASIRRPKNMQGTELALAAKPSQSKLTQRFETRCASV